MAVARSMRKHARQRRRERDGRAARPKTMESIGTQPLEKVGALSPRRPFDLDPAVLRRFPRQFHVGLPDAAARRAILGILLRDEATADDLDLEDVADRTNRFSGRDPGGNQTSWYL